MPNKFISLLFANGCHKTPAKGLVFKRDSETSPWKEPSEHDFNCEGNFSEVFRNGFIVPTSQHGDCLILFRDEHALLFNE